MVFTPREGLRHNEARMLDVADFGRNAHAPEFGERGVSYVRHGKAMKGSPPKPRSVLTVWPWVTDVLEEWVTLIRPLFGRWNSPALWPTERADRISLAPIDHRFAATREVLGLPPGLDFHSLRRSYVTHLIEDGWDPFSSSSRPATNMPQRPRSTPTLGNCISWERNRRSAGHSGVAIAFCASGWRLSDQAHLQSHPF
jgi:integrase